MKNVAVLALFMALQLVHNYGFSQNWQSAIMLEAHSGYTSNTYLTPLLPEWNRTGDTGYVMFAPIGQIMMNTERFSTELTAGGAYKIFFDDRNAWSGFFGIAAARYRVSDRISFGAEAGGGRFNTSLDRELYWIQPVLTWSPSMFTQLRLKAGSSFRKLLAENFENEDNQVVQSENQRFDSYNIEFEIWPDFRWQLRTSLYGNLDDPAANIGVRGSANYRIRRSIQWNLNAGLERFQYQLAVQNGGGGFPPVAIPGGSEQIFTEADLLLRVGTGFTWQAHKNISLNVQANVMNFSSSLTGDSIRDYQLSGGVRFSLFPETGNRNKADVEWRQNDVQTVILKLNYSGDGELYILGDFNNWDHPGEPLSRQTGNRYAVRLNLPPGVYEYKILLIEGVEEKWIEFSGDTYTVSDGFGGENGLIYIE